MRTLDDLPKPSDEKEEKGDAKKRVDHDTQARLNQTLAGGQNSTNNNTANNSTEFDPN